MKLTVSVLQIDALPPSVRRHRRQLPIVCRYGLGAVLVLATGCGREVTVRGYVTADGKPVHSGTITFQRVDPSGPAIGGSVKEGEFDLGNQEGLTVGQYGATLEGFQTTGRTINDYQRGPIPETIPLTLAEKTLTVQISKTNAQQLTLDFQSTKPPSKQ